MITIKYSLPIHNWEEEFKNIPFYTQKRLEDDLYNTLLKCVAYGFYDWKPDTRKASQFEISTYNKINTFFKARVTLLKKGVVRFTYSVDISKDVLISEDSPESIKMIENLLDYHWEDAAIEYQDDELLVICVYGDSVFELE